MVARLSAAGVSARHQGASHDESPRPSNSMTGLNWERGYCNRLASDRGNTLTGLAAVLPGIEAPEIVFSDSKCGNLTLTARRLLGRRTGLARADWCRRHGYARGVDPCLLGQGGGHGSGQAVGGLGVGAGGPASKTVVVAYGFWLFLLSDIVLFSCLFTEHAVLQTATTVGSGWART